MIWWYGPATIVTKYVDSGLVSASAHSPGATCVAAPLPSTTHSSGHCTVIAYGALRSGWSKHGK